jgi:hypothetical protein
MADDYCWTCGGDHSVETCEHGRVIRIPATPKRGPKDWDSTIPWDAPLPQRLEHSDSDGTNGKDGQDDE